MRVAQELLLLRLALFLHPLLLGTLAIVYAIFVHTVRETAKGRVQGCLRSMTLMASALSMLFLGVVMTCVHTIPPQTSARKVLSVARRRVIRYAREHNRLPATLAETSPFPGRDEPLADAWGRALGYSFDSMGVVTLQSLGADGAPGGSGDDRDLIGVFAARQPDGSWSDVPEKWIRWE